MTNMGALYKFVRMHYLINLFLYGTSCTGPYGQDDSMRSRSITLLSLISWFLFETTQGVILQLASDSHPILLDTNMMSYISI